MRLILIYSRTVAELRKLINRDETFNFTALRDATSWKVLNRGRAFSGPFPMDMEQSGLDSDSTDVDRVGTGSANIP
jgi:hypothetical protein